MLLKKAQSAKGSRYQSEGANYHPQQQQQQQQQQQDPYMNRSISDSTIMQRGSSMANAEENSNQSPLPDLKRSSHQFVKGASTVPPRHDSLRKINARFQSDGEKILEEQSTKPASSTPIQQQQQQQQQPEQQMRPHVADQYQANLNQEYMLPAVQTEGQNLDSFIDYYSPTSAASETVNKQQ